MSSIVQVKVGKYTYLYESDSYRNEKGDPRNKRKPVGKLDPATGQPVYKPEYLDRMAAEGRPVEIEQRAESFTVEDIFHSSIRDYGAFYFYHELAEQMGLLATLQKSMPSCWEEVFNLAAFLISTGDPYTYCENWLAATEAFAVEPMTSQRISKLLSGIDQEERNNFYQMWRSLSREEEYLAFDIASASSCPELVDSVEWGYARDRESLPQIGIRLLFGRQSRYPIYQSVYGANLKEETAMNIAIQAIQALTGRKPIIAVMGKGFYSAENVSAMLSEQQRMDFIVAVPFASKFARELVNSESRDMGELRDTIADEKESLQAVTRYRRWYNDHKVYTHIYYNARMARKIREDLYTYAAILKDQVMEQPEKYANVAGYTKYLVIRRSEKERAGYTVNLREDVLEAELETAGWMIIVSNAVADAKEAISIYKKRKMIKKGFQRLKNSLDSERQGTDDETSMQNKALIGFISLILLSGIHKVMVDKKLYSQMTIKELILTLSKQKLQRVNGVRVLYPITKEQRGIYQAFGIKEPI